MTCPRCHGFVLTQYGETRCLLCGWYKQPVDAQPIDTSAYRWDSVMCGVCHIRKSQPNREMCITCAGIRYRKVEQ